jgi:cytochrome c oxidase subunit II
MRRLTARNALPGLLGLAGVMVSGLLLAQPQASDDAGAQVIKVVARRFAYEPSEIVIRKGQPVVLEFTSVDFMHGFKVPDLNLRADLPPGKVTRVRVVAAQSGVYDFLCDNFCGSSHEEMEGRIVVQD